MRNRPPLDEMHHIVTGEDISMSSWPYGDPAPPILRAYAGDPAKIRLIHGGIKETYVFHLHNHQWRLEPDDPKSTIIDSISISPQECYTLDILYGAGSLTRTIGDVIFHCHLYPHFHEGMWTLWRIFDRLEDGTGELPDGTPIERLIPLKDRPCPPEKDSLHPGYPNFINGEPGERPLQPSLGILDKDGNNIIFPTTLEKANFVPKFVPGALYSETCPCKCPEDVRVFELAVVQAKITYNRYGWNDPQGRFFVLKEEIERHGTLENYLEKVNSGKIRPEPLVIRANAGEWIEVTLHNMFDKPVLYHDYPSVPLDMHYRPSDRVSLSPQFLKHCPVCSAGVNVGYNKPEQTVAPGECIKYLWYADKEYGTCMLNPFGDLRNHRYHGLFGAIIIEPPASQYYSNFGIRKENFSEQAVITAPGVKTFREFVLFAQNGIRLLDSKGNLIKTAQQTEESGHGEVDHEDTGEKGYNYRSERFFNRLKRVPVISKVFSSKSHGDPSTPLLQAYTGERVIIRYLMPADKPRNISFVLHGHNWLAQPDDPFSTRISVQGAVSVGGVYNIELENGASEYSGDYMYRSGSLKWDVESGMWGIFRVMKKGIRYCCECACRTFGNWWEKKWFDKYE